MVICAHDQFLNG